MDATTWSSRRRPQPCLLSRCSSCCRARSYSQLWVTATDPSGSHCSLFLPCLFMEALALYLSSDHCLCCIEVGRTFQRVSDDTFASLCKLCLPFPLITEEVWDSRLQVEGSYHQVLIWPVDWCTSQKFWVARFQWILFWIVVLHWDDADSLGLDVLHCLTRTGEEESYLDFNPF